MTLNMAKYIEITGVPGVGKTTTCEFVRKIRGNHLEFYTSEDINMALSGSQFLKQKILSWISGLLKASRTPANHKDDHLSEFIKKNSQLNKLFWEVMAINKSDVDKDFRFTTVSYTAKIFEKIQRVTVSNSNKVYVVDEGLIHSINNFISDNLNESFEQQVSKILKMIDLPDGVVYFAGDIKIVVDRTLKRKNRRKKDLFLSKTELFDRRRISMEKRQKCMKIIHEMDIPVLFLDAKESVEVNAEKILIFANKIQDNSSFPSKSASNSLSK